MTELAPGRFSTITGCLSLAANFCARCRAKISGEVPAGSGTTIRIGRSGYVAIAFAAMHKAVQVADARTRVYRTLVPGI
jgi:hypothetical protein